MVRLRVEGLDQENMFKKLSIVVIGAVFVGLSQMTTWGFNQKKRAVAEGALDLGKPSRCV